MRGIEKSFAGVRALRGVDFDIHRNEVLGLVGENGAGKSTLLKILAGLHAPDAGEILIDGQPAARLTPQRVQEHGFAFIHQEVQVVPGMSVVETMHLGLPTPTRFGLIDRRECRRLAAEVLGQLSMDVPVTAAMADLSLAQQVSVAIARAVGRRSRMVVMDEPTASFSPREVEALYAVIRRLREQGTTVIYVSHRLDEIFQLCDRVTVMRDGHHISTTPIAETTRKRMVHEIVGEEVLWHEYELPTPGEPVLELEGLQGERFGPIDLTVRRGEIVGLGGLVGSGRSSLIRLLYGADRPTGGTVRIDGLTVRPGSPRAAVQSGIGLVPEDRAAEGFISSMSVRENATMPTLGRFAQHTGLIRTGAQRRAVNGVAEQLKIKMASPDASVSTLSGGNQQKVVIAKWLLSSAKVLILDEPTRGIDVGAKEDVYRLIVEAAARGTAVIVASSELEELTGLCHRVIVVREGRPVGELTRTDINPRNILELCYAA